MVILGTSQSTFGNVSLNLKGMIRLLPGLKLGTESLRSRNLLQTAFILFSSVPFFHAQYSSFDFLNIPRIYGSHVKLSDFSVRRNASDVVTFLIAL